MWPKPRHFAPSLCLLLHRHNNAAEGDKSDPRFSPRDDCCHYCHEGEVYFDHVLKVTALVVLRCTKLQRVLIYVHAFRAVVALRCALFFYTAQLLSEAPVPGECLCYFVGSLPFTVGLPMTVGGSELPREPSTLADVGRQYVLLTCPGGTLASFS